MKTRLDASIPIEDFDEILREEKIQRKAGTVTLVFQYVVSAFVIIAGAFLCLGVLLDRGELETDLAGLPLLLTVVHAINSVPYVWWLVWLVLYAALAVFLPVLLSLPVFSSSGGCCTGSSAQSTSPTRRFPSKRGGTNVPNVFHGSAGNGKAMKLRSPSA